MILRKPYAFLIKYFRLIHLILSALMIYLFYKSYNLMGFLTESVTNNYNAIISGQVAGLYINYFMYASIIVILLSLIAVYYLLAHKNKPRKFYMSAIIYYIVLFITFTIFYNFINDLTNDTISSSALRAYRDISVLLTLPQLFFLIYTFVTFTGFNIKKFNFSEDIKELEIIDSDNEEFEFTIGFKGYKAKRNFRKYIREFKYYLKENYFIISAIMIILFIILGTSMFFNREVYNKKYSTNDNIAHNSFGILIEDSIISNINFQGEKIKENKYYVAVKMKVTNKTNSSIPLDYSNFMLQVGKKQVKPNLNKSIYFKDFANPYYGDKILKNSSRIIGLIYEIDEKEIKNSFKLKIYRGTAINPGEIVAKYNEIKLKPVLINKIAKANEVELNEKLEFIHSNVGNTAIKIDSFQFAKSHHYSYEKCEKENCRLIDDVVSIDYTIIGDYRLLLVLDYDFTLDEKTAYYKSNSTIKDFFENFLKVEYTIGNKTFYTNVINQTPKNLKDKLVLQIKSDVSKADNVSLVFTVRNKKYIIKLK